MLIPGSLSDEILNAATVVGVALALLTAFVAVRLSKFGSDRTSMGAWSLSELGSVLIDAALLVLILAVMVSMWPLVTAAWPPDIGSRAAVMRNLLLATTLAYIGLAGVQTVILAWRIGKHTKSSLEDAGVIGGHN